MSTSMRRAGPLLLALFLLLVQLHRASATAVSADSETGSGLSLRGVASPVTDACDFVTADGIEFGHLDRLRSFFVRRNTRSAKGGRGGNKFVGEACNGLPVDSFVRRSRSCILSFPAPRAAELILATSNQSDYICQ
jgi:hypothetical protein